MSVPQQKAQKLQGRVDNLTNAGKGRKKGVPNKATADLKALAGQYTETAMKELARLMLEAESEQARVSAIKEIFDRAFGKAKQSIDLDATVRIDWMTRALMAREKASS